MSEGFACPNQIKVIRVGGTNEYHPCPAPALCEKRGCQYRTDPVHREPQ